MWHARRLRHANLSISAIPPPTPRPPQSCAPRRHDEANAPRRKILTRSAALSGASARPGVAARPSHAAAALTAVRRAAHAAAHAVRSAASLCREKLAPSLDALLRRRAALRICSCARLSVSTLRWQEETACHLSHLARGGRRSASHARAVGATRHTAGSTFTWRPRGAVLSLGQDAGGAPASWRDKKLELALFGSPASAFETGSRG